VTHLIIREEGPVIWATMNRPERLNALNPMLVTELREFFAGLYWRPEIRVVVFSGAGRAFCAGLDLKEHPAATTKDSVGDTLTAQRHFTGIVTAMRQCADTQPRSNHACPHIRYSNGSYWPKCVGPSIGPAGNPNFRATASSWIELWPPYV
jgi:hypothetical protein